MSLALQRNQKPIPRKREKPRRKVNPYGMQVKKEIVAVRVFDGGREVLNLNCKAGADEYHRRKLEMWDRQGKVCALQITAICKSKRGRWPITEVQFDHQNGRTSGKQDDRIFVNGQKVNAAVCPFCNTAKGSNRRIQYIADAP